MTTRHEIPTHLAAPDRFALGFTAKQAMQLIAAASGAYGLLDVPWLPFELRVALAALAFLLGALVALIRPGGRALEEWTLLFLAHCATPRQMVWRPCPAPAVAEPGDWVALVPRIGWAPSEEEVAHVR